MAIDSEKVEALYRQYGPAIFRRCLKLLRNPAEAEDATQEVFVRVCRRLDRWTYGESPLPWLFAMASRHCLTTLRDSSRRAGAAPELPAGSGSSDVAQLFSNRQLTAAVMSRFDEKTCLIAVYSQVDGMSQEEIASALGISRKTVGVKLHRFLDGARKFLDRSTE